MVWVEAFFAFCTSLAISCLVVPGLCFLSRGRGVRHSVNLKRHFDSSFRIACLLYYDHDRKHLLADGLPLYCRRFRIFWHSWEVGEYSNSFNPLRHSGKLCFPISWN